MKVSEKNHKNGRKVLKINIEYSTVSVQYADPYLQKIDNLKIYPNKTQIQAEGKKVAVAVALKINFNKIVLPAA